MPFFHGEKKNIKLPSRVAEGWVATSQLTRVAQRILIGNLVTLLSEKSVEGRKLFFSGVGVFENPVFQLQPTGRGSDRVLGDLQMQIRGPILNPLAKDCGDEILNPPISAAGHKP